MKTLTIEEARLHHIAYEQLTSFTHTLTKIYPQHADKLRDLEMDLACEWIDPTFEDVIVENLPDGIVKDFAIKVTKEKKDDEDYVILTPIDKE